MSRTSRTIDSPRPVEAERSGSAGPLSAEERVVADRAARRLHDALRGLIDAFPHQSRNATALSKRLGIDRTTCQRAVFVASRPYPGPDLISRLPGVRGLNQLAAAARKSKPALSLDAIESLESAIVPFEGVVRSLAGSQSRLIQRLESASREGDASSDARNRVGGYEALFESAREVTGRSSDCWVAVYAYAPSAGNPRTLELVRANGLIGHRARADAVPLTFHSFSTKFESDADSEPEVGVIRPLVPHGRDHSVPEGFLLDFSSSPPPLVSSRQPNEFLVQTIDQSPGALQRTIDLMFASRTAIAHPSTQSPPVEEAWALINFPCRRLLFDVYLHRDLARQCIPALDAHLWRPDFARHVGDRWQTRFADSPTLQVLGAGLRHAASDAYERHADLTRFIFDRGGLDPSAFVAYRCDVMYPIWRAGYCMSLDFAKPE